MKNQEIKLLFFSKTYDFLNVYLPKHKDGSDHTRTAYKTALRDFKNYTNQTKGIPTGKFCFSDCTYDYVLDYRNYMYDVKKYKEGTVNSKLAAIRSYLNYAASRDASLIQIKFSVDRVPLLTVPKVHQPIIENVDSLAALLNKPDNTRTGLRDKVIMSALYDSGMRVQELSKMLLRDVDMNAEQYRLLIHGKGHKERILYLDEKTSALIKQYVGAFHPDRKLDTPFIYTTTHGEIHAMTVRNIEKRIKKYADLTRLDHELPDSVSPHTFRRTRGTNMYRDGVDISIVARHLGHNDMKTTKDHYTTPSPEQMKEIARKRTRMIPDEEKLWSDDEDELTKELGLL